MSEQELSQEGTQANEETEQSQTETQETEQLATEEMIEKFGLPKSFIGQPIEKVAYAVKSTKSELTKAKQELSNLKKAQKDSVKNDLKAPDPLNFENDDDYQKALRSFTQEVARQEAQQLFSPYVQQIQAQQQKIVMDTLQKSLPDGMEAESVANEWMEAANLTEDDMKLWSGNPNLLINNIVNFAKAKKLDEVNTHLEKESGDLALEKIQNSLRSKKRDYDLNSVDKTKARPQTMVQRILAQQKREQKLE